MKKIDFTWAEMSMPSWPMTMPASSVPVTAPRLKLPNLLRADPVADRQRQEDRQLRVGAESVGDVAEHVRASLAVPVGGVIGTDQLEALGAS